MKHIFNVMKRLLDIVVNKCKRKYSMLYQYDYNRYNNLFNDNKMHIFESIYCNTSTPWKLTKNVYSNLTKRRLGENAKAIL